MPITEEQRIARIAHLGSSDMAAVMGLSPFKTAYDVWLEKTGKLDESKQKTNPAAEAGNHFEDGVLNWAEGRLGLLMRNVTASVSGTPIVVNTDALVGEGRKPVEAKTTGLFGPLAEWWGDEGTDQVPDRVIVQGQCHMMGWKADICHVPVMIGGRGLVMFLLSENKGLTEKIAESATEFWDKHVKLDIPPVNSNPSLQVVKLVRRIPEKIVEVGGDLVQAWLDAKEAATGAKKQKDEAEAAVLAVLGDAEAATCPNDKLGAVTYFETHRKGYAVQPTTFRTLRHKKKGL